MEDVDPFDSEDRAELEELSEAVRDEDARLHYVELKALNLYIEQVAEAVVNRTCSGLIVLDGTHLDGWERQYGAAAFRALMNRLGEALHTARNTILRPDDVICLDADAGDSIVIFFLENNASTTHALDIESIAQGLKKHIFDCFVSAEWWYHQALEQLALGSMLLIRNDSVDPRREIYRTIRRARTDAQISQRELQRQRHRVVGNMIAQRKITSLYQPIIHMRTGAIMGFEALSRAEPVDAERLGVHLFVAAAKAELDGELDQTCRNLSIDRRPTLGGEINLFVNTLPSAFFEPMRELEQMLDQWLADGLRPDQLVFEINENITMEQLRRILPSFKKLRARGFRFAVDDVGTGTSNLQLLADVEPDFIKMDISLTRGIAHSERKQALGTYLLELARKCNSMLIAEGIENQEDHDMCLALGIDLGQGFLLGRPAPPVYVSP